MQIGLVEGLDVLILILMEDALRDYYYDKRESERAVLILILMEDALRDLFCKSHHYVPECLNPYSDGRCSKRYNLVDERGKSLGVLILILMEDALRAQI